MNSLTVVAATTVRAAASDRAAAAIAQQLPALDKRHVGAAMSKLISASIGDICVVMSKAPAYKFHTLADIEWLVMPAVMSGQFYVSAYASAERGFTTPAAVITWARVSDEVDHRLSGGAAGGRRLRPEEWTSGEHYWIIDLAGDAVILDVALRDLAATQLAGKAVKLSVSGGDGATIVADLDKVLSASARAP